MLLKQNVKGLTDRALRRCKAGTLRIRGITHQRQYTLFTDLGKALQVNGITKDRCIIHLKVTGMHNNTGRGIDRECCRIHDTVIRLDKFDPELS